MLYFIQNHILFSSAMTILNLCLAAYLSTKTDVYLNRHLLEAMGGRNERLSLYKRCLNVVKRSIDQYELKERKTGIYVKAAAKMKRAGFKGRYAALWYLVIKLGGTLSVFAVSAALNFPHVLTGVASASVFYLVVEQWVHMNARNLGAKFKRSIYKIYKYLHNQISSGVKPTDAVKSVYRIIDDSTIKEILVVLAARYELTLDINAALSEFQSNFQIHEAETLCVALKQGIETGDNRELLEKQEEVMFNQYFNYIQAETDRCSLRSFFAAIMFVSIVVIMISVPLFNDVAEAVSNIFSY